MKVKIHQEGQNIIFVLLFILLAINVLAFLFIELKAIPITLAVISVIMFALVLNFFRLPQRHYKGESDGIVVSSVDGKLQMPLEDTDCTGYTVGWLDDGSLVYVGEAPLSPDDPDYDANWHYRTHCIKRIYPDGHVEIIAHCGDFQVKQSVLH